MNKHEGCKRGFHHLSSAWYGKASLAHSEHIDQVMIGFYHPEGGTTGEFAVRWIDLGGKVTPRLEAFDDSWDALYEFRDVLKSMASIDGTDPTPEEFCDLLLKCGVLDMTERSECVEQKEEIYDASNYHEKRIKELEDVARAMRSWIDAIPQKH